MIEHTHLVDTHSFYLAVDGATQLMENAMNVNRDAISSWNERWETIFSSGLFLIIVNMSTFAGVAAICIWMVNELKDFDGDTYLFKRSFYTNLIWALFVMALLVPNGTRLANIVQGVHKFGQAFNQQALAYQLDDVALEDGIRASVARGTLSSEVSAQLSQCQAYIGRDQYNCLVNARQQIRQMVDGYEDDWLLKLPNAYTDIEEKIDYLLNVDSDIPSIDERGLLNSTVGSQANRATEATLEGLNGEISIPGLDQSSVIGRIAGAVSGPFLGNLGSVFQGFTHAILLSVQWGFVNSLEMAMLLTGLVAPFAVMLSFIPGRGRPIVAWILAYLSMVMVQFYYNLFTGIMGVVIVNSNAHDMNGFLIVLAIFGPVLAIKLAQGGGLAVFDTITSGSIGLMLASVGLAKAGRKK